MFKFCKDKLVRIQRNLQYCELQGRSLVGWTVSPLCCHVTHAHKHGYKYHTLIAAHRRGVRGPPANQSRGFAPLLLCNDFPWLALVNKSGSCWAVEANQITKCNVKEGEAQCRGYCLDPDVAGSETGTVLFDPQTPFCVSLSCLSNPWSVLQIIFRHKKKKMHEINKNDQLN